MFCALKSELTSFGIPQMRDDQLRELVNQLTD
jgi:hypothetical protein